MITLLKPRQRSHLLSVCLVLLLASVPTKAQKPEAASLFSYTNLQASQAAKSGSQNGLIAHSIKINKNVASLKTDAMLMFQLPDGKSIEITVTKNKLAQNGDTLLIGKFGENGDGSAVITIGKDVVFANITSVSHSYSISIDANRQPILINNKQSGFEVSLENDMIYKPGFEPMAHLKGAPATSPKGINSATTSVKSEVTILIIYSNQFANGFADPLTRINQMISFTNDAYDRSGINITLKLAHAQQLDFNNGTSPGTLLSQVRTAAGDFSGIPSLRDQYYADMVAVLPFVSGGGVSGIAYVNGDSQAYAYSVSQFAVWGSDSVFAHELGHNLGSGHERSSANPSQSSPCTGGYTGFSCGHGSGALGTIMSYLNDGAWGYVFSNPQINCNGEPCGIASGNRNSADNKTSFNITGPLVEKFRIDTTNDDDKDGVENHLDNCPTVKNSDQANTDSDQEGDACDDDDDNDTISDNADNCPLVENTDQLDINMNGLGDACEDLDFCFPLKSKNTKVAFVCL